MTDKLSTFHGIYDDHAYAQLSGDYVQIDGKSVCLRAFGRDNSLISGPGASFGGVQFDSELVRQPSIEQLAESLRSLVSEASNNQRFQTIVLRLGADCYYPASFYRTLKSALIVEKWQWTGEVTFIVSKEEFQPRSSVERNVRKALRSGLRLAAVTPQDCYQLMRKVKDAKGYHFSYTEERVVQQLTLFPNNFSCFGVLSESNELLASSIEVRQPKWSLLLNWDQTDQGRTLCATDFLLHQRLVTLFDQGVDFVDLGTITLSLQMNWGLARHKQNFGGHCEVRNSFTYQLDSQPLKNPQSWS